MRAAPAACMHAVLQEGEAISMPAQRELLHTSGAVGAHLDGHILLQGREDVHVVGPTKDLPKNAYSSCAMLALPSQYA